MFEQEFEQLTKTQQKIFSKICNNLLSSTFLARDKKDNYDDYLFLVNHKYLFDDFFKYINYEIVIDNNIQAIQLVSNEGANLLRLKKDETIYLLLLRIVYHEKMKEASSNNNVIIPISYLIERYYQLDITKRLNKTEIINTLRLFRKYNLIEPMGDLTNFNNNIIIFSTILLAINSKDINDIYNNVSNLVSPKEEENEEVK